MKMSDDRLKECPLCGSNDTIVIRPSGNYSMFCGFVEIANYKLQRIIRRKKPLKRGITYRDSRNLSGQRKNPVRKDIIGFMYLTPINYSRYS